MDFNAIIDEAVRRLKPNTTFTLINQARPDTDFLFNKFLPERLIPSFDVSSAGMTVHATMAGLVAMDSPLPKGGTIDMHDFNAQIAKIGMELNFSEAAQRKLWEIIQSIVFQSNGRAAGALDVAIENLTNWYNKLIIQPQLDTAEWMRGQALLNKTGISWQYNNLDLTVDYGMPDEAYPATYTGNNGFGGSTSQFWQAIRKAKSYLKYNVEGFYAHPDTIEMILSNSANNMEVLSDSNQSYSFVRLVGTQERQTTDARDRVTITAYGLETEVLDTANPGKTKAFPFLPKGKILVVGNTPNRSFALTTGVGLGGNLSDEFDNINLGYTHVGPTIEAQGRVGRYGRVYRPEARPEQIIGQSVTNLLPVIENVHRHIVLSTDMT